MRQKDVYISAARRICGLQNKWVGSRAVKGGRL